ncbi:MAG: Ig-like domain-containing protein, partial [Dehalococcoidia bacterium]
MLSLGLLTSSASAVVTPVANDDVYSTDEEVALIVPAPGVLENDQPGIYNLLTAEFMSPPSWGVLSFARDGSFMYFPEKDFNGTDSFTYRVYDNGIMGSIATVTINVAGVNDVPVTQSDGTYIALPGVPLDVDAAGGVLANDSDPEGDPLTAAVLTGPAHGTLTLNPDGSFTYTASAFYRGADTFTYSASDGNGGESTNFATLSVEDGVDLHVGGSVEPAEVAPGDSASFLFTVWSQG